MLSLSKFTVNIHPARDKNKLILLTHLLTLFIILTASVLVIIKIFVITVIVLSLVYSLCRPNILKSIHYSNNCWRCIFSNLHNFIHRYEYDVGRAQNELYFEQHYDTATIIFNTGLFVLIRFKTSFIAKNVLLFHDEINSDSLKMLFIREKLQTIN